MTLPMLLKPELAEERHRRRRRSKNELDAVAAPLILHMDLTAPSRRPIGIVASVVDLRHTRLVMAAAEAAGAAVDTAFVMPCWN